jgi:hypothetical protein
MKKHRPRRAAEPYEIFFAGSPSRAAGVRAAVAILRAAARDEEREAAEKPRKKRKTGLDPAEKKITH